MNYNPSTGSLVNICRRTRKFARELRNTRRSKLLNLRSNGGLSIICLSMYLSCCNRAMPEPIAVPLHHEPEIASQSFQEAAGAITPEFLERHVRFMASDKLKGRAAGYPADSEVTEYIADQFRKIGLSPAGENSGYFQQFTFQVRKPIQPWQTLSSRNVLGFVKGSDPSLQHEIIVLAAHHDGQGMDGLPDYGRLRSDDGADADDLIWNSANDDATGTAGVIAVANAIIRGKIKTKRSILFAAFGGEEPGLHGSIFYVNHPTFQWANHVAMIELEQIGTEVDSPLWMASYGTSAAWLNAADKANATTGYETVPIIEDLIQNSDHFPFGARGVPAIVLGRATWPDQHMPTDRSQSHS